jgi:hypothetical protein
MNKLMCYAALCSAVLSGAGLTPQQLSYYQGVLPRGDVYITQKGNNVNVMIPVNRLYQQQTTYMASDSGVLTAVLEELISQSSGKVYLEGILSEDQTGLVFATSALYAQVSHLSEYLLGSLTGISYAPVTVEHYQRNDNYGVWEIFPEDDTFVNLGLVID